MASALRDLPRLCPYLHLPIQSGADRVLASMRRGYTRAEYLEKVALLRERVPDLALTTDVIVGYPGETEAEFEATLEVLETVGFDGLFAFTYSPRPGTTALRLDDDVPEEEKSRRLQLLNAQQQQWQRRRNEALVGTARLGAGRDARRRWPDLGSHAALPDRAPRRAGPADRPAWSGSRSSPPPPTPSRAGFRNRFIDGQFRASYIRLQEGEQPWKSRCPSRG